MWCLPVYKVSQPAQTALQTRYVKRDSQGRGEVFAVTLLPCAARVVGARRQTRIHNATRCTSQYILQYEIKISQLLWS